jgi:hypothetical protein
LRVHVGEKVGHTFHSSLGRTDANL